jgi:HEAT repeat protein
LRSESPAVRKTACEILARFGTSEDAVHLREALRDPSREVVKKALQGIDALVSSDDTDEQAELSPVLLEALKAMLMQSDPGLQTDTAATLHRLGRAEGTEALRRLAASSDARVKSYAIRTISELEDPSFIPILLHCLEDESGTGSIRTEALKGLPKLAGQDIGRVGLNTRSDVSHTQQQIERWKAWGRENMNTAGR